MNIFVFALEEKQSFVIMKKQKVKHQQTSYYKEDKSQILSGSDVQV